MSYRSLAEFLEVLGHAGELVRVEAEVDPCLEAAEITRRVSADDGPAVLFGRVRGCDTPVLTNLLGTPARIARAFGADRLTDVIERVRAAVTSERSEGWLGRLAGAAAESALRRWQPRTLRSAPCQQVVRLGHDIDLGQLPWLKQFPGDAGPSLPSGPLHTFDFEAGRRVIGCYDMLPLDATRLAVALNDDDEPALVLRRAMADKEHRLPAAVVLGGDPALSLASLSPLPPGADALVWAGLLRDKPWELVKCRSHDLEVPADAEIIIEGYFDRQESPISIGPLCTSLGCYAQARPARVLHVTAVAHRANPVYPTLVRGAAPHEETLLLRTARHLLLPLVRQALPDLVDYDLPDCGGVRHWAFVSMRKSYAGQARKMAQAAWGYDPLARSKLLVIVDEGVDVHDPESVMSAIAVHVRTDRDLILETGPADPLDPVWTSGQLSPRVAIDATRKLAGEHPVEVAGAARTADEILELVDKRWPQYGLGPGKRSR